MSSTLVPVIVTLGPTAAQSVESTLEKLKAAGLRDAQLLQAVGIVTGRVAEENLERLRKVPGVIVEKDETKHIQ